MTIELHCTDAVSFMQHMADGEVDCAVFDPPYATISGGTPDDSRRPTGILESNDGKIFDMNDISPAAYLPELFRVLRPNAHVYMMTNFLGLRNGLLDEVQRHGFQLHNLLVWKKNNATPNRYYMKDLEYTILMRKGKAFQINDCGQKTSQDVDQHPRDLISDWSDQVEFPYAMDWDNVRSPKPHPTAKPVNLMRTYIENSTQPGELVFDMFMGAGSTGIAAEELGRDFLGLDLDPNYFRVACERMGVERTAAECAVDELI